MLFFIDETWQRVGGCDVGALGAVAIEENRYNAFCREVWKIKSTVLGANELDDSEIKGTSCFAKSAFRRLDKTGHSRLLQTADEMFDAMAKYGAKTFAAWTTDESLLLLRNPSRSELSQVYVESLNDFRRFMRGPGKSRLGKLFFDHRGRKEDLAAAATIQNFIVRVGDEWSQRFMQVPHFTPSAVSPGLQAADLVAYLAAHRVDPTHRPEVGPYWARVESLAYKHRTRQGKTIRSLCNVDLAEQRAGGR